MKLARRSIYGIVIAVSIAILLVSAVYLIAFSTVTVTGVVDHKVISGTRNQTQYTLVMILPWEVQFIDTSLSDLFLHYKVDQTLPNMTIDAGLEQKILDLGYSEILYQVSIVVSSPDPVNHLEPGDTLGYLVKRSDFNALPFWMTVEFEVRKGDPLHIAEVRD